MDPIRPKIILNFPGCVAYLCVLDKFIFEKRTLKKEHTSVTS